MKIDYATRPALTSLEDILKRGRNPKSTDEQPIELSRSQIYKQFQNGTLRTPDSQNEENTEKKESELQNANSLHAPSRVTLSERLENEKKVKIELEKAEQEYINSGQHVTGTTAILQEQRNNVTGSNLVAAQIQNAQENGGRNTGVQAGSTVSHGSNMSEQMKNRKAANQAENTHALQQHALLTTAMIEMNSMPSHRGGTEAKYVNAMIAGIRSDTRAHALKEKGVSEDAERAFETAREELKEEAKSNTVNGENIEEGSGETTDSSENSSNSSSGEGDIITTDSSSSSGEIASGTGSDSVTTVDPGAGEVATDIGSKENDGAEAPSRTANFSGLSIRV